MTGPITMRILGVPAPQGSKRHVGGGRMVEMSKKLPDWRRAITAAAKDAAATQGMLDEPLSCTATFVLPRPAKSKFTGPAGPPDLDKLERALGDGLKAGGLIVDDSRIVHWNATKTWAGPSGVTGAVVHLTSHSQETT